MSPVSDNDMNARKRVCKACDRCRLKKSKVFFQPIRPLVQSWQYWLSAMVPIRATVAGQITQSVCLASEKSHMTRCIQKGVCDKILWGTVTRADSPCRYVEMLEQQQQQLVNGLHELYDIVITNRGWKGAPLADAANGHPLTHDILERVGALKLDSDVKLGKFEEDLDALRQKLSPEGVGSSRNGSIDLDYKSQIPFPECSSPKNFFNEPFPLPSQLPPTPPIQNPHEQASMIGSGCSNQTTLPTSLDPSMLHPQRQTWVQTQPPFYEESMEFLGFDTLSDFNALHSMQDSTSHGQPALSWLDDDLNSFDPISGITWIPI